MQEALQDLGSPALSGHTLGPSAAQAAALPVLEEMVRQGYLAETHGRDKGEVVARHVAGERARARRDSSAGGCMENTAA